MQLAALARRAQTIVQLKPRSPETPLQGRPPIQAVCDYKQMEVRGVRESWARGMRWGPPAPCDADATASPQITVHKNDACALLSNAQPHKWRVLGAGGAEAVVPSVCFLVPGPNAEALDAVAR